MTCGAMLLAGSSFEGCSTIAVYKTGMNDQIITVPIIEMKDINKKLIRASNLDYDILLIKKSENMQQAWLEQARILICNLKRQLGKNFRKNHFDA